MDVPQSSSIYIDRLFPFTFKPASWGTPMTSWKHLETPSRLVSKWCQLHPLNLAVTTQVGVYNVFRDGELSLRLGPKKRGGGRSPGPVGTARLFTPYDTHVTYVYIDIDR